MGQRGQCKTLNPHDLGACMDKEFAAGARVENGQETDIRGC